MLKKTSPWRLFIDTAIHGTIGTIGDVLCINIGIYSTLMLQFFQDSINYQYGEKSSSFTNTAFSLFSASDILGNFFIGSIYVYLIRWFGSMNTWVKLRHTIVQISCILMILAKILNLFQLAILSRFLLGGSMFFSITENIFLAECAGEKYKDTVILNLITYYTVMGMVLTPLAHENIFGNPNRWMYLYILSSIVSFIYLLYTLKIYESPKELYINIKNKNEARKSLKYYLGNNVNIEKTFNDYEEEIKIKNTIHRMTIWEICKDQKLRKIMFLLLGVTAVTSISFYILVRPYLQIIYMKYGASISTSTWLHMSFQIIGITASLGAPWIFKHVSHKKMLTFYVFVIVITFSCILIAALLMDRASIGLGRAAIGTILLTDMTPIQAKDGMGQVTTIFFNLLLCFQHFTYLPFINLIGNYLYVIYGIIVIFIYIILMICLPSDKDKKSKIHEVREESLGMLN
ncbi:Major facilitator superfamily domain, general substrate transporter-containing protein [Strongyloides ratti]|uniref:Major facilitator superfamily domain, general substrate transporter-containing protein n=1 Tax=Strongyloides ratti TaxID=34506 RepID=A0A090L338_STRRB|nr:Major facilitator superfamily domain, general substrate transporter-containing protein [Strongyloides ratti]CEF61899.1 Major facilitator superfamily domain, general substrate transporter-containing protein [Strongyloides ratti]